MDDHDRENLQFLLNASPEVLSDWYDQMDEDDHEYAQELLAAYAEELRIRASILEVEESTGTNIAAEYLKKFRAGAQ